MVYWHVCQIYKAYMHGAPQLAPILKRDASTKVTVRLCGLLFPKYLTRSSDMLSFALLLDLLAMMMALALALIENL